MFAKLLHLYSVVDQTVNKIITLHPKEVKCQPGCADCCNAVFDLSLVEATYLAVTLEQNKELREKILVKATTAQEKFQLIIEKKQDPSGQRIKCPLLGEDKKCLCYEARPINCRTYGTPTVINGQGHVCGISGFGRGNQYPTINLEPLQKSLYNYSVEMADPKKARRRFTIAETIINSGNFFSSS